LNKGEARKKVLFSAPYMVPLLDRFMPVLEHYNIEVTAAEVEERLSEGELMVYAGQYDGVVGGDDQFTREVLQAYAPRLKVISKWGTGIDSIDKQSAESMGIRVCNTPNAFTLPVADTVMGYVLAFARCQPWMDRAVKDGEWRKTPGRSLSECTIGVVGVGRIGKAILRRARVFEAELLGNDIIKIEPDFILENGVEMTDLKDLLERSDFVSLNCDLNPTSFHLINDETLGWMKPTTVLVNTSRGPVVDEQALIRALEGGKIGGAALDVFEEEPLPQSSPLCKMDNVMVAAHNANSSPQAWERVHRNTIRNLVEGLGIPCSDFDEVWNSVMPGST